MRRAYSVVLAITIGVCAVLAGAFELADHQGFAIATGVLIIAIGVGALLARGPLRWAFEQAGLDGRDDTFAGRMWMLSGAAFGVVDASLMRLVLGPRAGFAARFAWLAISFTALLAIYALLRRNFGQAHA